MKKLTRPTFSFRLPGRPARAESGQSIIMLAFAFIALVAFIGLTVDVGILFIGYGHLRRAVDAAAIAAAAQLRENYAHDKLVNTADEYLHLNGVNLNNASASVLECKPGETYHDASLCSPAGQPRRKLVRVQATNRVDFAFLPILGFGSTNITADAIGEAASLDVVLAIDISESMTYDTAAPVGSDVATAKDYTDPSKCNVSGTYPCQPFTRVKDAAKSLVDYILNKSAFEEEDRISLIFFSNGWEIPNGTKPYVGTQVIKDNTIEYSPGVDSGWFNDHGAAIAAINNLKVYDPFTICDESTFGTSTTPGLCRWYDTSTSLYKGMMCPLLFNTTFGAGMGDQSTCTTTNIGGALWLAGYQFGENPNLEAVWVTILLTDGAANATCVTVGDEVRCQRNIAGLGDLPLAHCPDPTNYWYWYDSTGTKAPCRDDSAASRHAKGNAAYDADDYARDAADFVACAGGDPDRSAYCKTANVKGQGSVIFTIGLGAKVAETDAGGVAYGDYLMRKIAAIGDDGDPVTDPCNGVPMPSPLHSYSCGNYYFSETGTDLVTIFDDIASRVFTRIAK